MVAALAPPGLAYPRPGRTERVSVASDGTEGPSHSVSPAISADGRYVAFTSRASNLVPADTNAGSSELLGSTSCWDVFVRDQGPAVGVGEVSAALQEGRISVSGWTTFSGQAVASAGDPPGDGGEGAEELGADLTGASLVYRPEREDLLARLRLASLPQIKASVAVGAAWNELNLFVERPLIVYGLSFELDGTRYEVRALRAGIQARCFECGLGEPLHSGQLRPRFALYRCEPVCIEQARLPGAIGTTGVEVVTSVPLSALQAEDGAAVTGMRAFAGVGEEASGAVVALDEANLPDGAIPAGSISLGIAPQGTPAEEVAFDDEAALSEGVFSGSLDVSALPPGDYDVWARACMGETCGGGSTPVRIG